MALHSPDKAEEAKTQSKEGDKLSSEKLDTTLTQTWQQRRELLPPADTTAAQAHLPVVGMPSRAESFPAPVRVAELAPRSDAATGVRVASDVSSPTRVTPKELEFVRPGLPEGTDAEHAQRWQAVKDIVAGGVRPESTLLRAVENSRLVGIGDHHVKDVAPTSPMYDMLKSQMKELAKRGVTDMFIEFPQVVQPVFDAFNSDPKKGDFVVPSKIIGPDGKPVTGPEAEGGLKFLQENRKMFPQTIEMWRAARDAGINLHAVDSDANAYARGPKPEPFQQSNDRYRELEAARDRTMAQNMHRVLNESGGKGIALLGSLHVASQSGLAEPNAFQLLTPELAKRNEKVSSAVTLVGSLPGADVSTLYPLTSQISAPTAVDTKGVDGKPNAIADVNFLRMPDTKFPVGNFDHVFLFPNEAGSPKFTKEFASGLRDKPELNTPAGRMFNELVDKGINWGQMPPGAADKGGSVAKQVLDRMLFNNGGVPPEGFDKLQSALGIDPQNARSLKDVNYVVVDSRGHWEHGAKVESALRSGDPSAADKNIVNLWLPATPPAVPEHLQPRDASPNDRRMLNEAQSYGVAVSQDLDRARSFSESVVKAGGTAPDVILPQIVSPYYLGKGDALGIGHQELGVEPLKPGQTADAQYKQQVLDGLHRLADGGDVRAKSVLETLGSLNRLADTSKVYLSANNEDKLDLAVFLGDMHPNVVSVSSLDRQNQTAQYNEQTARFAKALAYGSVVSIPENVRADLDMSQFSHVIVREPDASDKLAGQNVSDLTLDDKSFKQLQSEHSAFLGTTKFVNLAETFYRARGELRYEGELAPDHLVTIAKQSAALQDALKRGGASRVLPSNFDKLSDEGKQEAIRQIITDGAKTALVRAALFKAASRELTQAHKVLSPAQIREQGADPRDLESSTSASYSAWYDDLEKRMSGKLLTFDQTRVLHANARPEKAVTGDAPAEMKALLFNPQGPMMSELHEYVAAPTRSGRTIALGIEVGNSFSAPYLSARERYRRQNGL